MLPRFRVWVGESGGLGGIFTVERNIFANFTQAGQCKATFVKAFEGNINRAVSHERHATAWLSPCLSSADLGLRSDGMPGLGGAGEYNQAGASLCYRSLQMIATSTMGELLNATVH